LEWISAPGADILPLAVLPEPLNLIKNAIHQLLFLKLKSPKDYLFPKFFVLTWV
jgi:hypothetical protein